MVLDRGKDREKRENSLFPCLFLCFRGILTITCGVDCATLRLGLCFCWVNLPRLSPSVTSCDFLNGHSIDFFGSATNIPRKCLSLHRKEYFLFVYAIESCRSCEIPTGFLRKDCIHYYFLSFLVISLMNQSAPVAIRGRKFFSKKCNFFIFSFGN